MISDFIKALGPRGVKAHLIAEHGWSPGMKARPSGSRNYSEAHQEEHDMGDFADSVARAAGIGHPAQHSRDDVPRPIPDQLPKVIQQMKITKAYQTEVTGDVRVLRNTKRTLTRMNTPNGAPIANFQSSKPQKPAGISWHLGRGIMNVSPPKLHGGFTRRMTPSTQGRIARITGMGKSVFGMAKFDPLVKRFVPREERRKDAKRGHALPDGSFPIDNESDLHNAERLVGRSKHPAAARALIERRKRELNKGREPLIHQMKRGPARQPDFIADAKGNVLDTHNSNTMGVSMVGRRTGISGFLKPRKYATQWTSPGEFEKAVVAGTRPFARRALPQEQVKQVRAKAPRYGVMKSQEISAASPLSACAARDTGMASPHIVRVNKDGVPECAMCGQVFKDIRNWWTGIKKSCDNCGVRPASGDLPLCVRCADPIEKGSGRQKGFGNRLPNRKPLSPSSQRRIAATLKQLHNDGAHATGGPRTGCPLCVKKSYPDIEKARKGGKHAPFVRPTDESDERGEDNEDEKADKLPRSFRKKSKAVFATFPLGPLSKTYVRVDAARAEGFIKADTRGYPQSQCPECGKHGNALEVMQHMQATGHTDDDKGMNRHTMIGRGGVPELDGHTGMGTLKSMRKGFEFKVLDENDPEYHGHTGGGAGYAGKKWVHMHGPQWSEAMDQNDGPKDFHRHFKMGEWTTHHSPSGYQDEIIGHTGKNEADSLCALPNCGHPESRHSYADDGRPACMDCNSNRPRRNVRHSFRSTPDPRSA